MVRAISGDRWLAFGGVLATVGGAAALAIWQSKPHGGYWQAPGIVALAVVAVGFVLMFIGLLQRGPTDQGLQQSGGDSSTNLQAGRDINVHSGRSKDD